jgi:hypothetical protein
MFTEFSALCRLTVTLRPAKRKKSIMSAVNMRVREDTVSWENKATQN